MANKDLDKFEQSQTPSWLEDEFFDHSVVYVSLSIQTVEKLLKMKKKFETISDCIERLVREYALLESDES